MFTVTLSNPFSRNEPKILRRLALASLLSPCTRMPHWFLPRLRWGIENSTKIPRFTSK